MAIENLTDKLILEPKAGRVREQAMWVSGRRTRQREKQLQSSGGKVVIGLFKINEARVVGVAWVGGKSKRYQKGSRVSNCERTFSH